MSSLSYTITAYVGGSINPDFDICALTSASVEVAFRNDGNNWLSQYYINWVWVPSLVIDSLEFIDINAQ